MGNYLNDKKVGNHAKLTFNGEIEINEYNN